MGVRDALAHRRDRMLAKTFSPTSSSRRTESHVEKGSAILPQQTNASARVSSKQKHPVELELERRLMELEQTSHLATPTCLSEISTEDVTTCASGSVTRSPASSKKSDGSAKPKSSTLPVLIEKGKTPLSPTSAAALSISTTPIQLPPVSTCPSEKVVAKTPRAPQIFSEHRMPSMPLSAVASSGEPAMLGIKAEQLDVVVKAPSGRQASLSSCCSSWASDEDTGRNALSVPTASTCASSLQSSRVSSKGSCASSRQRTLSKISLCDPDEEWGTFDPPKDLVAPVEDNVWPAPPPSRDRIKRTLRPRDFVAELVCSAAAALEKVAEEMEEQVSESTESSSPTEEMCVAYQGWSGPEDSAQRGKEYFAEARRVNRASITAISLGVTSVQLAKLSRLSAAEARPEITTSKAVVMALHAVQTEEASGLH